MSDTITLQDRIETLEYLQARLTTTRKDIRTNIATMIDAYKVQVAQEGKGYPYARTRYIPPAL